MHLAEATWTDVDAVAVDVAVLPVGSTEQHGPHAPLGTDHLTARAVAERAAADSDREVVVAPPIPVGISEEHRQFTGTLFVDPDTFRAYVRETVESMLEHGWDRVVVVNGHGGNADAIREVAAGVSRHNDALVAPFTWFDGADTDLAMGHAGPVETSLLLATHPDLVREGRIEAAADGAGDRWGDWTSGVNLAYDSAEFSENGAVGDPREASDAAGNALLQSASEALVALFDALSERELGRPPHK